MQQYALHTGRAVPVMGLGTWQLSNPAKSVSQALDLGYRLIDTSSDYCSHAGIGKALARTKLSRDDYYLISKVEEYDNSYNRALSNLEELGLESHDLLLIHRPPPSGVGEELWEGLQRAQANGLTRDIGVSNYSIEQLEELTKKSGIKPVVNQIEWSPFGYSREMLRYCQKENILIQAYTPLTQTRKLSDETLGKIAQKYGKSPAQIILKWDLELGVCPIPKAGQLDHQRENLDIFDFELEEGDVELLSSLNTHFSYFGSLSYL